MSSIVVLIPAYQPGDELERVVTDVRIAGYPVVVVNDGSHPKHREQFERMSRQNGVTVIHHATNLGKGAALKTGFNHILVHWPEVAGIVTADADGQHAPADIAAVAGRLAERPASLVLGVRQFPSSIPFRSRAGNLLTRTVFHVFTGRALSDTQTGLRGWPREYARECLRIPIAGYDFELDALVRARKLALEEVPIETIYLNGNQSSHFSPLRDSARIYFVFVRYCGSALLAAAVDTAAFSLLFSRGFDVPTSQACGRAVSVAVTFFILRRIVFRSEAAVAPALVRYLTLVAFSGWLSYGLITWLHDSLALAVISAKMLAEGLLFLGNFAVQREFVFPARRD